MKDNAIDVRTALDRGDPVLAAAICSEWRKEAPASSEAFNLSGIVALQSGETAAGLTFLERATECDPRNPKAWSNLASAGRQAGREGAWVTACFKKALDLAPDNTDIRYNLALALHDQGMNEAALATLDAWPSTVALTEKAGWLKATVLHRNGLLAAARDSMATLVGQFPSRPDFLRALGDLCRETGDNSQAEQAYRTALQQASDDAESLWGLGHVLVAQGQPKEGRLHLARALDLAPDVPGIVIDYAQALVACGAFIDARRILETAHARWPENAEMLFNLGMVHGEYGDRALAEQEVRQAIALDPELGVAHNYLGILLEKRGLWEAAHDAYRSAIRLDENFPEPYSNLGNLLAGRLRLDEAERCYRKTIKLNPNLAEAHHNLGLLLLLTGRLEEGWRLYRSRWKAPDAREHVRVFARPEWRGEPLDGKKILVHAEQGFGDTLQFVRYMPLLRKLGAQVIFESQSALIRLLEGVAGIDHLMRRGDPFPEYDFHVPLLNLPGLVDARLDNLPAVIPYVFPLKAASEKWRTQLSALGSGLKVGIAWAGNPKHANDRSRSLPVRKLALLADIENLHWISLQKHTACPPADESNVPLPLTDWTGDFNDYTDTAALIDQLDLVVAVDTSVAHLAGALGKPVWIMLPYAPDWRWLLGRSDTPWYPTAVLYRQSQPGDWAGVLKAVRTDLEAIGPEPPA